MGRQARLRGPEGRPEGQAGGVTPRLSRQNDGSLSILHYEQSLNLLFCIVFYKFLWYAEHSNLSLSPGDSISETGVIYYGQTDYGRQGFRQDQAAH